MKPLSNNDKLALMKLLSDDDAHAIRLLEEAFLAKGENGARLLEQIVADGSPGARKNAEMILQSMRQRNAIEVFAQFCADGSDLETGVFLLAHARYPNFVREKYAQQLDEIAEALRPKLDPHEPQSAVEEINRLLFGVLAFRGNTENYYDTDNSFINRVLDRRMGIPITLSALYLFVGWRLELPLVGVGMPGHFIIKWQPRRGAKKDEELLVDPFHAGRILSERECVAFLTGNGHKFTPAMLAPVNSRQMLARMCHNLVAIYQQADEPQLASQYENFAVALAR